MRRAHLAALSAVTLLAVGSVAAFTVTAPPSPTSDPTTTKPGGVLPLPRVPWEGADYWGQFPKAKAAGWSNPSFFPIVLWYGSAEPDEQVKFDKAHGINTYAANNPGNPYSVLADNGMFSLYKAHDAPSDDKAQVGVLLDDEVDGRYSDAGGVAHLRALASQAAPPGSGLFRYVNYTSSIGTGDRSMASSSGYINGLQDAVSLDAYLYSVPHCDTLSLRWRTPANGTEIDRANCRTSSSYGKMIDLQREVDVMDGHLQTIWGFVEVISTGGTTNGYKQPTPSQIKGAAINEVIHGARGVLWFSQSPDQGDENTCRSGDSFRDARIGVGCPAVAANVVAVGQVNALIKSLAPVLNTQSYVWDFGVGIDSTLKVKDGAAYILAMPRDGGWGKRTFTLPAGVTGRTVEVVGEGRTVAVSGGRFVDKFASESTYHVYKIAL